MLVDDRLVMRMFNLNTNPNDQIDIYVDCKLWHLYLNMRSIMKDYTSQMMILKSQ